MPQVPSFEDAQGDADVPTVDVAVYDSDVEPEFEIVGVTDDVRLVDAVVVVVFVGLDDSDADGELDGLAGVVPVLELVLVPDREAAAEVVAAEEPEAEAVLVEVAVRL